MTNRKLVLFMMVSLDGYYEAPGHDIDWHTVDADFNAFAVDQLNAVDTIIFGRATYEIMAAYWPTPEALANDPKVTGYMNRTPKIVISHSLAAAEWANTRLIKDNVAAELTTLKQQPGKDLIIFGSGDLAVSLTELGLIDEYRVMVAPVALGAGKPLFTGLLQKVPLKLIKTTTFRGGNVLLCYEPAR
jgi:dihydrofolate reductase